MVVSTLRRCEHAHGPVPAAGDHRRTVMRIGEDQQEFEILPSEEDQPIMVPEPERAPQPDPA
jgi:hypothetical protein